MTLDSGLLFSGHPVEGASTKRTVVARSTYVVNKAVLDGRGLVTSP